jgi:hypothetical protein
MTTRIGSGGPSTGVSASSSAVRVTAPPGQPFKAMMHAGAQAILTGAEGAVTRLPGGPILAAALRPAPTPAGNGAVSQGSMAPEGPAGSQPILGGAGGAAGVPGAEASGVEATLSQSVNQNLYFIEIQERISAESRSYSAISNVLKARHDTVKNAIGNIR